MDRSPSLCAENLLVVEIGATFFCSVPLLEDVEILTSLIFEANAKMTNPITSFVMTLAVMKLEMSPS